MGIVRLSSLDSDGSLVGLWQISEDLRELKALPGYLPEWDEHIARFKSEEKKKQFIASRLLIGSMSVYPGIGYTLTGKPYLLQDTRNISISHSGSMAAVLLSTRQTGIDLERVSEKVGRVAPRFLAASELEFAASDLSRTICWCAKEALYKMDGNRKIIFAKDILIDPFAEAAGGNLAARLRDKTYHLVYELIDDFILVYVLN